jgi:hypothetical protein
MGVACKRIRPAPAGRLQCLVRRRNHCELRPMPSVSAIGAKELEKHPEPEDSEVAAGKEPNDAAGNTAKLTPQPQDAHKTYDAENDDNGAVDKGPKFIVATANPRKRVVWNACRCGYCDPNTRVHDTKGSGDHRGRAPRPRGMGPRMPEKKPNAASDCDGSNSVAPANSVSE